MKDSQTYYYRKMPNADFCVEIFLKNDIKRGGNFKTHWHGIIQRNSAKHKR